MNGRRIDMELSNTDPLVYHITYGGNLRGMVQEGRIWSDRKRIERSLSVENIGHSHIKDRRLKRPVPVAMGGTLGDYVPFNFCPRSVMLYVVLHGGTEYRGQKAGIVHLVTKPSAVIQAGRPWAFTDRHADLKYARYFADLNQLDEVDWDVMPLVRWDGDRTTTEKRQAEFLVYDYCPWSAIHLIGVYNAPAREAVMRILANSDHKPAVTIEPGWYY